MTKLSLRAPPSFLLTVDFPVHGGKPVPVLLTLKHRTRVDLSTFMETTKTATDEALFLDKVEGWDLEDTFERKNVDMLLQNYAGVAVATYQAYVSELMGVKRAA